jgi:diadenosine tetraphosphatase ApaH/serine/threonine PP2A family protein phosphatase
VINEQSAIENFLFQTTRIGFNAHSHVAVYASHREKKRPKMHLLRNMFLPRNQRLLIGVGSVGQPRDGNPRAAAVIYDASRQSVHLVRVAYDVDAAARQIAAAGLPEQLAQRLRTGQ